MLTTRPDRGVRTTSNEGGGAWPAAAMVAADTAAGRPWTRPSVASATCRSARASIAVASSTSAASGPGRTPSWLRSAGRSTAASRTAAPSHTRRTRRAGPAKNRIVGKATRNRSMTSGRLTMPSTIRPRDSDGWLPSLVSEARRSAPRMASEVRSSCHRSASGSCSARSRRIAATVACSAEGASRKRWSGSDGRGRGSRPSRTPRACGGRRPGPAAAARRCRLPMGRAGWSQCRARRAAHDRGRPPARWRGSPVPRARCGARRRSGHRGGRDRWAAAGAPRPRSPRASGGRG